MKIERLEYLIANEEPETFVREAAELGRKEREALGKEAVTLKKCVERQSGDPGHSMLKERRYLPERLSRHFTPATKEKRQVETTERSYDVANLAVLAFAAKAPCQKAQLRWARHLGVKVLIDRKPDWADEWLAGQLEAGWTWLTEWSLLVKLVESGTSSWPNVDGLVRHIAANDPKAVLAHAHARDELVWRLFAVDTFAFHRDGYDWAGALVQAAETKQISRARLIDECLEGLSGVITKAKTLAGFQRLHDALVPTDAERRERLEKYLDLLASPQPQTVTFALDVLKKHAKELDGPAFLAAAARPLEQVTKTQPLETLKLLEQIVAREPGLASEAASQSARALEHAQSDVQGAALRCLAAWWQEASGETKQRVRGATVAVIHRETLAKLGAVPAGAKTATAKDAGAKTATAKDASAKAATVAASADAKLPPPLWIDSNEIAVLSGRERLEPVRDLEELIDLTSRLVARVEHHEDIERWLDGVSRFGSERPPTFEARTAALRKRLAKVPQSTKSFLTYHRSSEADFLRLWLGDASESKIRTDEGPFAIWVMRLMDMEHRLRAGTSAPLLALPTHRGGWIDPAVLVERLQHLLRQKSQVLFTDFVQALLRLAPDGRSAVLPAAAKLEAPYGRILAWALGSSDGPTAADSRLAMMWLAAGRARTPFGALPELEVLGFQKDAPYAELPATYRWGPSDTAIEVTIDPKPTRPASTTNAITTWPSVARNYNYNAGWQNAWLGTAWPLNHEPGLAMAVRSMSARLHRPASVDSPNAELIEPLVDPSQPWSPLAHLAVATALAGKDADASAVAVEALAEAFADTRAHPKLVVEALAPFVASGLFKCNRLAPHLRAVAQRSPTRALMVVETVEMLLVTLEKLPADIANLLDLWLEQLVLLSRAPNAAALQRARSIAGGGNGAKRVAVLDKLTGAGGQELAELQKARTELLARWSAHGGVVA